MKECLQFGSLLWLCIASGCASVAATPQVAGSAAIASKYIFRGVPQVDDNVLQADSSITLEQEDGSAITSQVWTNVNLSSDTGDAVMPNGHGGTATEVDFVGDYTWTPIKGTTASLGFINYSFPNIGGASTTELYLGLAWEVAQLSTGLTLYYDVEQIDGAYLNGSVGRSFQLEEGLALDLSASLGCMDEEQARAYVGTASSGLSDLVGSVALSYVIDANTNLGLSLSSSTVIDDDQSDALEAAGLESDNTWLTLGVDWSF